MASTMSGRIAASGIPVHVSVPRSGAAPHRCGSFGGASLLQNREQIAVAQLTHPSSLSSRGNSGTTNFGARRQRERRRRAGNTFAPRAMIEGGGGDDEDDSLLSKLNPFKAVKKAQQKASIEKQKKEAGKVISDDMRKQMFGEGLMGRMAAGMINNVAGALKEQMSEATEKSEQCYDAATRLVSNDPRVRKHLGDGVQCTPPMSQMSSSMNVNGGGGARSYHIRGY